MSEKSKKKLRDSGQISMVLSFLLAVVVWYSIKENINFESQIDNVPVTIVLPEHWAVWDKSVSTVTVQFRGTREDIRDLGRDQVKVQYVFSGDLSDGQSVIKLTPDQVITTTGAEPVFISPSEISLRLDREGSRILPVKADLKGRLPEGINVEEVTIDPNQIEVFGPESRLDEIEFLRTESIDLEGKARSFINRVELVEPSQMWDARLEPNIVNVNVEISDSVKIEERKFENISVLALIKEARIRDITIEPEVITAIISGEPDLIESVNPEDLTAFVDCSNLGLVDDFNVEVQLNLPRGLEIERIEPEKVTVTIE